MSKSEESKDTQQLSGVEAYRIALETRNFEIGLFWQRSNYFLVLNAALAIGFFRLPDNKYSMLFAGLGAFVSFLWFRVNLGSKYWQSRWEYRLKLKEEEIAPGLDFFSANKETIKNDVKSSFEHGNEDKGFFQKWLEKQALQKPSVSYNMSLLSFLFLAVWGTLLLIQICTKV